MIPAILIKELEKRGFYLEFPRYDSNNKLIIDILKQKNERLHLSLPLILRESFDYEEIIKNIPNKNEFNKIIIITNEILKREGIDNTHILASINKHNIKRRLPKEFENYYETFKDSIEKEKKKEEESLKQQIHVREKLNLNKSLVRIFSPGKRRIMNKIFNHEELTNTELKYYYRSIRPLILAISNDDMRRYLEIIESTKKYT